MIPLTIVTIVVGVVLVLKGLWMILGGPAQIEKNKALLYNRPLGVIAWVLAIVWVLVETLKLGPSDFGEFKGLIFSIFAVLGLLSIWMLRDYLVVRAGCILTLMISWWVLKAAYLQLPVGRLMLAGWAYVAIIGALWLAVAPWRARDVFDYLAASARRTTIVGSAVVVCGVLMFVAAASYTWIK